MSAIQAASLILASLLFIVSQTLASTLSVSTTTCAVLRGDCKEDAGMKCHSQKAADGYERTRLVADLREQDEFGLSDNNEDNFDRAFPFFQWRMCMFLMKL